MKCSFTILFLLIMLTATAQVQSGLVSLRVNAGIGLSVGTERMFGEPFYVSGELGLTLPKRWQLIGEGGIADFRDAAYPTQKVSLFGAESRYQHGYLGISIGRNLLSTKQKTGQLLLSTGADYLLIIDPGVRFQSGIFSGYVFDYKYIRCLNIPVQLDYAISPFHRKNIQIMVSSRWNFNRYHSFPTLSTGINLLF